MKNHLPNILFILSDQHRFCDIGFEGNQQLTTQNLDRLASEGVVFDHTYSNCPVCVPARGTLLTGLHAFRHGAAANDLPIRPNCRSIAHALNEAGYLTAYIGKWNLGGIPRDRFIPEEERLGFRYWRGNNCNHDYMHAYYDDDQNIRHPIEGYEPIAQTTLALEFLKSYGVKEQPWALWLCFGTPHDPYLCLPDEDVALCHRREPSIMLRDNVFPYTEFDYIPRSPHHATQSTCQTESPMERERHRHHPDFDQLRLHYAGYYRHIEYIDLQIGRLLSWLDNASLADDTSGVYTSDHGNMLGSHGLLNKQWYYEESAHIPFIIRWPGHIEPGHRDLAFGLVDIVPSLLRLAGVRCRYEFDGEDISSAIRSSIIGERRYSYLYSIIPAHQAWYREIFSWRALTDGHMIYAANQDGAPLALYNLDEDPLELENLVENASEMQRVLQTRLLTEVEKYDGYLPWQTLVRQNGLTVVWNRSQEHFGYPPLVPDAFCMEHA